MATVPIYIRWVVYAFFLWSLSVYKQAGRGSTDTVLHYQKIRWRVCYPCKTTVSTSILHDIKKPKIISAVLGCHGGEFPGSMNWIAFQADIDYLNIPSLIISVPSIRKYSGALNWVHHSPPKQVARE